MTAVIVAVLVFLGTLQPWDGASAINNVEYPSNIEQLWTPAQLAAIGLCKPPLFVPPGGQVTTGSPSYINNGNGTCSQLFATTAAPTPSVGRVQFLETLAQNSEYALATGYIGGQSVPMQIYWAHAPIISINDIVIQRLATAETWTVPQLTSYFNEAATWSQLSIP